MAALSPKGTFYLYVMLSGLFTVGVVMLWRIGRALRHRHDRRHEVVDPTGRIWSTRLHWGRPSAGFGLGARLFPRRPLPTPDPDSTTVTGSDAKSSHTTEPTAAAAVSKKKKNRWWDWLDVFEIFDEGFLIGLGLAALIGLIVTGALVVLLAIEFAVVSVPGRVVERLARTLRPPVDHRSARTRQRAADRLTGRPAAGADVRGRARSASGVQSS